MKVRVLSCAEREFAEAVDFYNAERPGLGYEFAEEVQHTLDRIASFPDAWPLFSHRARRCIVRRFPYGVLYQVRADCVLVKRRPWQPVGRKKRSSVTWPRHLITRTRFQIEQSRPVR